MKQIKSRKQPKVILNLKQMVQSGAEEFGDKTLYVYKEHKEEKTFTYRDNWEHMTAFGTALAELGLMGKHVAVIGETTPHYMTTFLAVVNGGGVIVPLDKDLDDEALISFMNIAEAEAVVYTGAYNKRIPGFADRLETVRLYIPLLPEEGDPTGEKIRPFDELLTLGREKQKEGNTAYTDHVIDPEKLCAILFTSGTTGTSKGVMLSQKNFTAAANASCQSMQYDDTHTFVDVLPMHHTYEITCGQLAIQNLGSTMCINDSLKNVMRNFQHYKPDAEMLVPLFVETMYKKIWAEIDKKGMTKKVRAAIRLSNFLLPLGIDVRDKFFKPITEPLGGRLNSIVCGGAPISPQLIKDFHAFGIFVLEGYGITECAPLVAVNSPGKVRYHSVGQPVNCCQVRIDKQEGEETGEIQVKGDNVMMGYYKNEEATKAVFTEDGWFRTGDIGYIDKDNYIFITGRKKNVIILSNGKNVFPEELEERLKYCESVEESVVLGRKGSDGEVRITALIYPKQGLVKGKTKEEAEALVKAEVNTLNKSLPVYKQIREVELRETEFEKTTTKKIKRYVIQ